MESKKTGNRYIVRLDKGEEVVETIKLFCKKNDIKLGQFTGLGAADKIKVGLFNVKTKEYHSKEFTGDYEIAPLYGNITTMNGEIYLHFHINFSDDKHNSYGGHLNYAFVSATFEGVIEVIEGAVDRQFDKDVGLNLLKF